MNGSSGSSGVGGGSPSEEIPGLGKVSGVSQTDFSGLMHAGVANLGQLKAVLIKYMGEKKGLEFYNEFMKSVAMQMLHQLQQSAQSAREAAQNMQTGAQ